MTIPNKNTKGVRRRYIKLSQPTPLNTTPKKYTASKNSVPAKTDQQLFSDGGDFLAPYIKPGVYPFVEKMRAASLAGDWGTLFRLWPVAKWARIPLGKFRFTWGADGKPRYVPLTEQDFVNYFSGPWLTLDPVWKGICPQDFINKYSFDYYHNSRKNINKQPNTHPHHIRRMYPPSLICKKKQGSVWLKVRKPVVAAAAIVTAVYLGPALLAKIKALGAAKGAGAAASGSNILSGSKKVVDVVNKGRTIQAIAKGKLPPPPINVGGSSWRDWALLVAKDELQSQMGRNVTADEESAMRIEIAAMQRELVAVAPRNLPAQPIQTLSPQIQRIQVVEEQKAEKIDSALKTALIVGLPLAFIVMGS